MDSVAFPYSTTLVTNSTIITEALVSDASEGVKNWGCGYFGDRISSRLRSNGVIKTEPLANKTLSLGFVGSKAPRSDT